MKIKSTLISFVCLLVFASCTAEDKDLSPPASNTLTLRMAGTEGELHNILDPSSIEDLTVYQFEKGKLAKILPNLFVADGGAVKGMFLPNNPEASLYLLANAGNLPNGTKISLGISEADFRKLVFTSDPLPAQGAAPILSGYGSVRDLLKGADVPMTRSFARLDIEPKDGVGIKSITLGEVAQAVHLFEQPSVPMPGSAKRTQLTKKYENPLTQRQDGALYLYEQTGKKIQVEVKADINGVENILTAALPATIKRNHVYSLRVVGMGANIGLVVDEQSWKTGDVIEATPDLTKKVTVDVERSTLPATVMVNANKDTVYIPYWGETFKLALKANTELEVKLNGMEAGDPEITVTPAAPVTRASAETGAQIIEANVVNVNTRLTAPGSKERYVYLEIRNKNLSNYYGDRIVLVIQKNATVFSGRIYELFDGKTACNMTEYADGVLGFVEVPATSTFTATGKWLKVEEQAGTPAGSHATAQTKRYKIHAGYKPNDPEADGRIQEGSFKVTHTNGKTETYPISRPNNGLPVILVDGKYWAKFNLKGNARSFEDQIQINDPAAQKPDLYEYLKTCSDEEYMRLMGDAYKGWHTEGLKLKYNGEGATPAFTYENYASTPGGPTINSADPTQHCPPGYQIPNSADDYFFLFGNRNTTFPTPDADTEQRTVFSHGGVSRTAHRYSRLNIAHDGGTIPRLYLNKIEFSKNGQSYSYTLFSSGIQTNNTTMDLNLTLFANTTATGHLTQAGGKLLTQTNRGVNFTRAIRCVKSPVEFIITD